MKQPRGGRGQTAVRARMAAAAAAEASARKRRKRSGHTLCRSLSRTRRFWGMLRGCRSGSWPPSLPSSRPSYPTPKCMRRSVYCQCQMKGRLCVCALRSMRVEGSSQRSCRMVRAFRLKEWDAFLLLLLLQRAAAAVDIFRVCYTQASRMQPRSKRLPL